jgi:hypothetical protein
VSGNSVVAYSAGWQVSLGPLGVIECAMPVPLVARRFKAAHRVRLFVTSDDQDTNMPAMLTFRHAINTLLGKYGAVRHSLLTTCPGIGNN